MYKTIVASTKSGEIDSHLQYIRVLYFVLFTAPYSLIFKFNDVLEVDTFWVHFAEFLSVSVPTAL